MSKTVDIDGLADAIKDDLFAYSKELKQEIDKEAKIIADETVKNLRNESNVGERGLFAKGWKSTINKKDTTSNIVIHNKEFRLTHLINDGHKMRQGGRSKAFRLVTRNEAKAHKKFYRIVGDILAKR